MFALTYVEAVTVPSAKVFVFAFAKLIVSAPPATPFVFDTVLLALSVTDRFAVSDVSAGCR